MNRVAYFAIASICSSALLSGCASSSTCSLAVGNSTITFIDVPGSDSLWTINSVMCDGAPIVNRTYLPNDTMSGSCSNLGDTDFDLYWKFRMGQMCYPEYMTILEAKANASMVSSFVQFTAR